MANVIEFVFSLKDLMSTGLSKIVSSVDAVSATVSKTTKNIENTLKKAIVGPATFKKSVSELTIELERINKIRFATKVSAEFNELSKLAERLERRIKSLNSGNAGGMLGKTREWGNELMGSIPGGQFLSNPVTMSGGLVAGIWEMSKKAMVADKEKMQLKVLTDDKTGEALFGQLTKFATDTVFGTELYGQAAKMIGSGFDAGEIMPMMKMLGDVSMGDTVKLEGLSHVMGQVRGQGKLMTNDLYQMQNNGFYPLQGLMELTGDSMEGVRKRIEEGKISYNDILTVIQKTTGEGGKFHNMLEKIADTPFGQFEQMKGTMSQLMVEIGTSFLPILNGLMQGVTWVAEKMGPLLQPVIATLGVMAVGLLAVTAAQWLWNIAQMASPITWVILGVVALIAGISVLINNVSGWGKAWDHTVKSAEYMWKAFTEFIKVSFNNTVDILMIGINKIKEGWYNFAEAVGIGDSDANQAMLDSIANDTERRKQEMKDGSARVVSYGLQAANHHFKALNSFTWENKGFGDIKDNISKKLGLGDKKTNGNVSLGGTRGGGGKASKVGEGITHGGARTITININKEMIGNLGGIHSVNINQGLSELEAMIEEGLKRILYQTALTVA